MKKIKLNPFTLITLILILTASYAHAAKYTFAPRLNVDTYYTDNVFQEPDNEQDDFVTSVGVGLAAGVEIQTASLDAYFNPRYQFYSDFDELNEWLYDAGLNGFVDIAKNTRLSIYDRFSKLDNQFGFEQINRVRSGDPTASLDPTVRQGRGAYWENAADIRLDHKFGVGNTVFAAYNYRILRNDDDIFYEDSDGHRGDIGATYYLTPKWGVDLAGTYVRGLFDPSANFIGIPASDFNAWGGTLRLIRVIDRRTKGFVEYTYSHLTFDDDPIVSVGSDFGTPQLVLNDDYDVHAPLIGVEYEIEQDLTLTASGGYFWQVPDISKTEDGWMLNLLLRKTLKRGGVRLEAGAGYDWSYFTAENLGFTKFYRAGITGDYEIFRRFYGDVYATYRQNEYLDEFPRREDDRYLAGGGFTWQPTRWAAIRVGYALNKIDSNFEVNSYTENRFLLNLSLAPDLPFTALY
jgi:hypothetical protein